MTNSRKYSNNMLIIMVNKGRNRFAEEFAGNITVKRLSLVFGYEKSKYKDIMFTDVDEFIARLIKLVPLSCKENKIYESVLKEIDMLDRFENFLLREGFRIVEIQLTEIQQMDM